MTKKAKAVVLADFSKNIRKSKLTICSRNRPIEIRIADRHDFPNQSAKAAKTTICIQALMCNDLKKLTFPINFPFWPIKKMA